MHHTMSYLSIQPTQRTSKSAPKFLPESQDKTMCQPLCISSRVTKLASWSSKHTSSGSIEHPIITTNIPSQDIHQVFSDLNIQFDKTKLQRVKTQFITTSVERGETSYDPSMLTRPMIHQDRDILRSCAREIKHIATSTNPQPWGWTTPSSSWWPPGW